MQREAIVFPLIIVLFSGCANTIYPSLTDGNIDERFAKFPLKSTKLTGFKVKQGLNQSCTIRASYEFLADNSVNPNEAVYQDSLKLLQAVDQHLKCKKITARTDTSNFPNFAGRYPEFYDNHVSGEIAGPCIWMHNFVPCSNYGLK